MTVSGAVGDKPVESMLLDSGADISIVAEHLVPESIPYCDTVTVVGVGGQQNSYKTALVPITIKGKSMSLFAAIAPTNHLTHEVILGRNLPGMSIKWSFELEEDTTDGREMDETPQVEDTRSKEETSESVREESSRQEEPKKKVSRRKKKFIVQKKLVNEQDQSQQIDTKSNLELPHLDKFRALPLQTRAMSRRQQQQEEENRQATEDSGAAITPLVTNEDEVSHGAEEDVEAAPSQGSEARPRDTDAPPMGSVATDGDSTSEENEANTVITKDKLINSQQEDVALHGFFDGTEDVTPPYLIRDGILYRKNEGSTGEDYLIVVPDALKKIVLRAGHDLAGHFAAKKTKTLIQEQFYWRGSGKDIVYYCKACQTCLEWNVKRTKKEPLKPLPVITTPWTRIAIDIVGPLPRTTTGFKYLLTLMDFGTRFIEAIPMKKSGCCSNL